MLLNCGVGEDSWESLGLQGIKPVNPKENYPWIFIGRTDNEAETPTFWPLMWNNDSLEKTLMLGKTEGKRRRGQRRMRWLDSIANSRDVSKNKLQQLVNDTEAWCAAVHGITKNQTWVSYWTEPKKLRNTWEYLLPDQKVIQAPLLLFQQLLIELTILNFGLLK